MNYLAHARLSFGDSDILTGNLISDFVKGKKKLEYPSPIRDGIHLHRAIDEFTDGHEATRQAKTFFRADYRLYAGALVDVVYDHFLANDPVEFATEPALAAFAKETYHRLGLARTWFPERFGRLFPYMESQDWLTGYRYREGIFRSFAGLARRAAYMPGPAAACEIFLAHYGELGACYDAFYTELKD
ncbi:MAG: ACP phosphodiesterase, partial [Bacteroidota bacterium]|nr:ACP phosphodiesterase [Bacteroidota bacterium]